MYYGDNSDRVLPNDCRELPPSLLLPNAWVHGWIDLGVNRTDDTNTLFLTQSLLAPQLGTSVPVWHCPSDKSTSRQGGKNLPRVRTVSMNGWLGCDWAWDYTELGLKPQYRLIKKTSDLIDPGPSQTFVFTDEREDSINDCYFGLSMLNKGRAAQFIDWPGSYHNGAGTFSFADGHAEIHKWKDGRTIPPLKKHRLDNGSVTPSPNNPDIAWLQDHATGLK